MKCKTISVQDGILGFLWRTLARVEVSAKGLCYVEGGGGVGMGEDP